MLTPLEAALAAIDNNQADAIDAAKCRGLMVGYAARWNESEYLIDDVEALIESDLWNPETQRKSRSFTVAGKKDVSARPAHDPSRRVLFDHKTTSEDIADLNAPFWRHLRIEGQASLYMLLEWLNGRKVDECVWDVVRKPSIRPSKLSAKEIKELDSTGLWYGCSLTQSEVSDAIRECRETPALYAARLAYDCTTERPGWYLQRMAVPRMDAELVEYAAELWEHGQDLLHERAKGKEPARNPGGCMSYSRPCQYLGICSGYDTTDSRNWRVKEQVHNELSLAGDGRDVLTNSRIRCFQTCRRKEYYQYRLGIERVDDEEAESLRFGRLWHLALEAYFTTIKEGQNGRTDATGAPVNGIGTAANEAPALYR